MTLDKTSQIASVVLLGIAVGIKAIVTQNELPRLAERYANMSVVLNRIRDNIDKLQSLQKSEHDWLRIKMEEAKTTSLDEAVEWRLLFHFRELNEPSR